MSGKLLNLPDALAHEPYDHCIAATYEFGASYFERYCLERFEAFGAADNMCVLVDAGRYAEALEGPAVDRPRFANRRYLLHPVPVGGRFHPKLYLFATKKKGLLLIGSANLTEAGFSRNAEMMQAFRFQSRDDEASLAVFSDGVRLLRGIAERWGSASVHEALDSMIVDCPWLGATETVKPTITPALISNLERPLIEQLATLAVDPVERVTFLSPFFDEDPSFLDEVERHFPETNIDIYTDSDTTMTRAWARHASVRRKKTRIRIGTYADAGGHRRRLHAKAIIIESGPSTLVAHGSANATRAALFSTPDKRNFETLLVTVSASKSVNVHKLVDPWNCTGPLTNEESLCERAATIPPRAITGDFRITEVVLDGATLTAQAAPNELADDASIHAFLQFEGAHPLSYPLRRRGDGSYTCQVDAHAAQLATEETCRAWIEARRGGGVRHSNVLLLVCLVDTQTGRSSRLQRRLREAESDASLFAAHLAELIAGGDDERLKYFLSLCNIRIPGERFGAGFSSRTRVDDEQLRELGARNLRVFETLHEAAMGFIQRHLRRMKRHCIDPTRRSMPGFMHVARAVTSVCDNQVQRLLFGLEAALDPLSPESWGAYRRHLDEYLTAIADVGTIIADEYAPQIAGQKGSGAVLVDVEPIRDALRRATRIQERLLATMEHLRVGGVKASLFPRNVTHPEHWSGFVLRLKKGEQVIARFAS
jgi:HKD family nuclease